MVVAVGKTGSGKSEALHKFLKPVEPITAEPGSVAMLQDDREKFRLRESYVFFFDEMASAERTCVEAVKHAITAPKVEWRMLHTNHRASGPNRATFVGASNRDITISKDPTSARRFYQITTLQRTDWDAINAMDMLSIWKSVDDTGDAPPIKPHLEELAKRQEGWRAKSSVEEWLEDQELEPNPDATAPGEGLAVDDLYAVYKEAQDEQGAADCRPRPSSGRNSRRSSDRTSVGSISSTARLGATSGRPASVRGSSRSQRQPH